MSGRFKVSLIFPPQWTASQPYYALAALNGHLRREGFETQIFDLNLEFFHFALRESTLNLSYRRLLREKQFLTAESLLRLAMEDRSDKLGNAGQKLLTIEKFLEKFDEETLELLADEAQVALEIFTRRDLFYQPELFVRANGAMDLALKLFSLPFYPSEIAWNNFSHPLYSLNLDSIEKFSQNDLDNPFYFFYRYQIPRILDSSAQLYAVSINSFSQVLPGLTLARMLREALVERGGEGAKVSIGGNFFTRLKEVLREEPRFFEVFADIVSIGEGERSIVELATALSRAGGALEGSAGQRGEALDRELREVSNILYLSGGEVVSTSEKPNYRMEEMAFVDFTGFQLERYLAPERVVALRASKGCYWGKCAFCDSHYGLSWDQISVERLVEELLFLRDNFGIRHIEFIDQCIPPDYLEKMADAFLRAELNIRWFCNGWFDPKFLKSPELFSKLHRAGNTMIMWGVESGSKRLLKLMRKGISPRARMEILRAADRAGIWNFAYIFFGFPTETREEAFQTIQLIAKNTDIIHSYGRSIFSLGRHSPIMKEPEKFGIVEYFEDKDQLSTNLHFRVKSGIQGREVEEIARLCTEICRQAYRDPLWMLLRSRENLHLYLAARGKEFVRHYKLVDDHSRRQPQEEQFVF